MRRAEVDERNRLRTAAAERPQRQCFARRHSNLLAYDTVGIQALDQFSWSTLRGQDEDSLILAEHHRSEGAWMILNGDLRAYPTGKGHLCERDGQPAIGYVVDRSGPTFGDKLADSFTGRAFSFQADGRGRTVVAALHLA